MRVSNYEEASLLTERLRFHLITNLEGSQPGTLCFFLIRCYLERDVMSSPEVEEDQPSLCILHHSVSIRLERARRCRGGESFTAQITALHPQVYAFT